MKEYYFPLLRGMERDSDEKVLDHHVFISMADVHLVDQPFFLECPGIP
jgi:hypothetical protein